MGQLSYTLTTKMKTFIVAALAGLAAAAPSPLVGSHQVISGHGALVSHGTHAFHGAPVVAHAAPLLRHAPVAVAHAAPLGFAHAAPFGVSHAAPIAVAHAVPLIRHAPVAVAHAAPLIRHAPVAIAHPVAAAYETEEPYSYQYGVADDYSNSNFNAAENADAAGNVQGSYSVALPDGRIQTVKYTSDNYNGYVADVSYEGTPVYPPAAVPVAAPAYQG